MSDDVTILASAAGLGSPALAGRPEFPPDDPTLARTPVTLSSEHAALGMRLRVDTNDQRVAAAARLAFGPPVERGLGESLDAWIRLFVHHVDEEPGFRPRQPLVRSHGGTFWIAASRSSVVSGNADTGQVMGFVSETVASNSDYLRMSFVQSAFLQIAQPRSLVAVHSACLARDGRSLMLRGDSGAGKSTLCYAALRRGYALVAEDVIFLRSREGRQSGRVAPDDIELHGLPWTLHLLPDAPAFFPELAAERPFERPDGKQKIGVAVEERFPGQAQHCAPLGPLVFVERGARSAPRLSHVPPREARDRLAATAIHYEQDEDAEHGLWDAFLSFPVWRLETSDDPNANAAILDQITTDGRTSTQSS